MPDLPGLVVFAPLPPMPTGIADYTHELLPHLARHYRITLVAEDAPRALHPPHGVRLMRLAAYHEAGAHAATHLYMLGNNPDHLYLLPVMARRPGVVVLHDPGLHHLLDCATAALGDVAGYAAALEAEYGKPGALLAAQWRDHELRDSAMVHDMPMLRHLLGPARHVIVHSRTAALKALAQAPHVPLTIAPHHYLPPPTRPDAAAARARLGIAPDEIVFLSLGFVSHIKRIDVALRALARIAPRLPPFRYVIGGELRPDELDVERLAASLGLARQVIATGYLPACAFHETLAIADVVINLRHPVGGETSGTLIRALGGGACVVVTDAGPFAEIPDGAAVKLQWGPAIETALADALLRLAISPATRAAIGARAAAEITRRHHIDRSVAAYRGAIDEAAATKDRPWRSTARQLAPPPQHTPPPRAPLWQRLGAVPALDPPGSVLARAPSSDLAALRALGHVPRIAPPGWQPAAETPRAHDLALLVLAADDALLADPGGLAHGLNRMLRFGGTLVLVLRDADPRAHTLCARGPGTAVLEAAGFAVRLAEAAAPPRLAQGNAAPLAPEPPTLVWRAEKRSEILAPRAA